jgi:hypothetical protein
MRKIVEIDPTRRDFARPDRRPDSTDGYRRRGSGPREVGPRRKTLTASHASWGSPLCWSQRRVVDDPVILSRIQFAFTITYHYLFPQLTMGLALLIFILKTFALRRQDELYNQAARFWSRIFAVSFIMGVVTGIPMEFEFGTNWARFSAATGSIIAQLLAMEGAFAFFLESAFVGLLLFGEQGP